MLPTLSFNSNRRFGIELEIMAFDGKSRPDPGQKPAGIDYVGMLIAANANEAVDIKDYEHTDGNDGWVIKPDSSCGMEICTPIYKGWSGLKKCCQVVHALSVDPLVKIDQRCSIHVHVEIEDLDQNQLASVIAHWFKTEPIFMDSVPASRKRNRYCQFMGLMEMVEHDTKITPGELIKKVGAMKYYSLNTNQYVRNNRKTIEFRIGEGEACKDSYYVKNWIRLLVQFVERSIRKAFPLPYNEKNPEDPWQSFLWLDVEDTLRLLGFDEEENQLSLGLIETRNWFLARLNKFMGKDGARSYAYAELQKVIEKLAKKGTIINDECIYPKDVKNAVFSEETKL